MITLDEVGRQQFGIQLQEVFDSGIWSGGSKVGFFEESCSDLLGTECVAVASGGAALLAILEYIGIRGKTVLLPANTFWATAQAVIWAGGIPEYVDCCKEDLCMDPIDLNRKLSSEIGAVIVVHIGGHIAFHIEEIANICAKAGVPLVEDCCHAIGSSWQGRTAGSWGLGGAYSFYATKTLPLGEGGLVCSRNSELASFVRTFRDYGKYWQDGKLNYKPGKVFNYRMSEIIAALGIVQLGRLESILDTKRAVAERLDKLFERRIKLPKGMLSGYYKYIVFDYELKHSSGRVYAHQDQCHVIEGVQVLLPNTEWIANHHSCIPVSEYISMLECSDDEIHAHLVSE